MGKHPAQRTRLLDLGRTLLLVLIGAAPSDGALRLPTNHALSNSIVTPVASMFLLVITLLGLLLRILAALLDTLAFPNPRSNW